MSKKFIWIIIIIAAVIIVAGWVISMYNSFVRLNAAVDTQWAQVETQYQRRFDLIPNLVNSVKGILTQEQTVFGDIADARTRYAGAATVDDKVAATNQMETGLGRLLAIIENYPQLKSSENVKDLMTQLEGAENRVSVERGRFNNSVKALNIAVQTFPGNVFAGMFGFKTRALFEAVSGAETAPTVNLDLTK
ncbi:MAG: LemA family protein [Parcubacteria group bacterium]